VKGMIVTMKRYIRKFSDDFSRICQENREETMIIYDTGFQVTYYSYEKVEQYVYRYLELFKKNGLKQGDAILSLVPNSAESIICFFAVLKGGYAFAPLPCYATEREVEKWTNIIKPKLIIKKKEISLPDCVENSYRVISINCNGDLEWLPKNTGYLLESKSGTLYLFTSGTTGVPKAMVIDGDTLWSSGCLFMKHYNMQKSRCRFWNYLPMSYLGGLYNLALIPVSCGGSFLITEPFSGKTILNFWNNVKKYEITALWFVPTIINGLLKISKMFGNNYRDYCKKNLKIALIGTAPITREIKEDFEKELGVNMYENYALSETTFITGENEDVICYREQSSVGEFLPYVDYELRKYEDADNIFELWIKTPFMFRGYLNEDGKVDDLLDEKSFLNTKDLVRISKNGQVIVVGRDRDIIKKGGMFVSLKEIECLVKNLDYIQEVATIPINHDFYGESYLLCIVLKDQNRGEEEVTARLKLWLVDNVVQYKQPEAIKIYKEFPYTSSGKIKKGELRKQYEH